MVWKFINENVVNIFASVPNGVTGNTISLLQETPKNWEKYRQHWFFMTLASVNESQQYLRENKFKWTPVFAQLIAPRGFPGDEGKLIRIPMDSHSSIVGVESLERPRRHEGGREDHSSEDVPQELSSVMITIHTGRKYSKGGGEEILLNLIRGNSAWWCKCLWIVHFFSNQTVKSQDTQSIGSIMMYN